MYFWGGLAPFIQKVRSLLRNSLADKAIWKNDILGEKIHGIHHLNLLIQGKY